MILSFLPTERPLRWANVSTAGPTTSAQKELSSEARSRTSTASLTESGATYISIVRVSLSFADLLLSHKLLNLLEV